MDATREAGVSTPALVTFRRPDEGPKDPGLRLAWAVFLVLGLPFLLMATLTSLAAAGFYVEPLRVLWRPWPPDALKPLLGIAAFAATLGYLAYRVGRSRGYHSGERAGLAAARNLAEGWKPRPSGRTLRRRPLPRRTFPRRRTCPLLRPMGRRPCPLHPRRPCERGRRRASQEMPGGRGTASRFRRRLRTIL